MVPGYPSLWEIYYDEHLERHGVREWMFQLATIIGPEVGGPWGCGREGLPLDETGVWGGQAGFWRWDEPLGSVRCHWAQWPSPPTSLCKVPKNLGEDWF